MLNCAPQREPPFACCQPLVALPHFVASFIEPSPAVRPTLLIPELIWPEPDDQLTLGNFQPPALSWLLAHAHLNQHARRSFELALADAFGLTTENGQAPLAALRRLGDGHANAQTAHWLCAEPVHLRFHHERIVLADAGAFDLDIEESQALIADLNQQFADIGEFVLADAKRWYLRLHQPVEHAVLPISAMAGRRIDGDLPKGDPTLTRWLNEVQMFLHGHPVNEARQGQGKPAINSIWLWGGGKLPTTLASPFSSVLAEHPIGRGLARLSGLPLLPISELANIDAKKLGARPFIVLDTLLAPVLYEDGPGWQAAASQLDTQALAPLRRALGKSMTAIDLIAPTVYGEIRACIQAGERWKFWKKPRPLAAFARQFAENAAA